jgi:hypothetical protein
MTCKNGEFSYMDSVSLREFLLNKITDHCKEEEVKFNAIRDALTLAREILEKRLEGMNEFRAQLKDQNATFITREYYDARHKTLQKQVDDLRISKATFDGKASQSSVNIAYFISSVSIIMGIISIIYEFIK